MCGFYQFLVLWPNRLGLAILLLFKCFIWTFIHIHLQDFCWDEVPPILMESFAPVDFSDRKKVELVLFLFFLVIA